MSWKDTINRTLSRTTGYQLQKTGAAPPTPGAKQPGPRRGRRGPAGDRLLTRPTFILCTVRSGSTLLRVILDSHSQVRSPHELHLRDMRVEIKEGHPTKALKALDLDERRLQYLLWDRVLHRDLAASGKTYLVNKTPSDVHIVDRIVECWPDARFIFLLRHPLAIARSRANARKRDTPERNLEVVLKYGNALEDARQRFDGLTVRYEDLTTDPARVTKELCAFLDVEWEATMLDYGEHDHGQFRAGLGDWKDKIKSGEIQPAPPPPAPEEIPAELRSLSVAWGYLEPDGATADQPSVEVS
jgi:hypothetical protein